MCVRVVEPVALVFGKLLSTNHCMLQNVKFLGLMWLGHKEIGSGAQHLLAYVKEQT